MTLLADFFAENMPGARALVLGGPLSLVWAAGCLMLAGYLKMRCGWRTGFTRKLFHFLIFGSVVVVHLMWGTPGVCLFGAMTSVVIAYALFRGDGSLLYEAMAREKDAPWRTYYIVIAYLATLVGGLASNMLFPGAAVLGYLVVGVGDAIAEPVGTAFGRHPYRVPSLGGVSATRTLEGSLSVFLASLVVLVVFHAFIGNLSWSTFFILTGIALLSTLVEAVSPHGSDNATMQLVPAWLGALWL